MQRFRIGATAAILALLVSQPSLGTPPRSDPATYLQAVETELSTLQELAREVRNPELRQEIQTHARNARYALDRATSYDSDRPGRYGNGFGQSYRGADRTPRWQTGVPVAGHGYGYNGLTYQDAREIVSRESFDSGRLAAIERIAGNGRFTTEEVRALVEMCSFESTKQRALIALFPAVVDPNRFELALAALDFTSSRRAVAAALGI